MWDPSSLKCCVYGWFTFELFLCLLWSIIKTLKNTPDQCTVFFMVEGGNYFKLIMVFITAQVVGTIWDSSGLLKLFFRSWVLLTLYNKDSFSLESFKTFKTKKYIVYWSRVYNKMVQPSLGRCLSIIIIMIFYKIQNKFQTVFFHHKQPFLQLWASCILATNGNKVNI